ncbi:MAG TPA: 2-amino-4-hydroxy-6-hydroxymethyldihydropteridine diphosphokinase [Bacteroidales bacterium]|nr:2-amino-4-hydroxy-6-hydroxymethyldihydropteridine diphosphokinase [Bacteroidales bacterium]HOE04751.1 2-amino-4-hydroxy-6-hydroxymethyldihydropteridine diphosphokinase [Bacteroidales bacterium]
MENQIPAYEVLLSTGGNLGDRWQNLVKTRELVSSRAGELISVSPVYISEPWGFRHQKYFLNQVLNVRTTLPIETLLHTLQTIESDLGRTKKTSTHYEGRTVDIDILDAGALYRNSHKLVIPHPALCNRLFVLLPLRDIFPCWTHPVSGKKIDELIALCPDKSKIRKISHASI